MPEIQSSFLVPCTSWSNILVSDFSNIRTVDGTDPATHANTKDKSEVTTSPPPMCSRTSFKVRPGNSTWGKKAATINNATPTEPIATKVIFCDPVTYWRG